MNEPRSAGDASAVREVARRVGRPVSFVDDGGYADEIVSAAVDEAGGRYAWLGRRSKGLAGAVEVAFLLRVVVRGTTVATWSPVTHDPRFGLDVVQLEWGPTGLLFRYREIRDVYSVTFDDAGRPRVSRLVGSEFVPVDEAERDDAVRVRRVAILEGDGKRIPLGLAVLIVALVILLFNCRTCVALVPSAVGYNCLARRAEPGQPASRVERMRLRMEKPARTMSMEYWSGTMAEADERDRLHWLSATPVERMEALELIRARNYGYADEDQPRPEFQRLYRVAELRGS